MQRLFGTDGVRGRANQPPMTVETALAIGRAAGVVFGRRGHSRVVIGKDTRLSGYMFENALIAGLCSMGVDTYMVGPLPTPGVAYITRAYRADAGIVISASHNRFEDNGIKFFSAEGFKLEADLEREIERVIELGDYDPHLPCSRQLGRNRKIADAQGRYIEFVKASFPRHFSLDGMKIAVDCAHGAAYYVAPLVFSELGAEVFSYSVSPNGLNINEECGALHPKRIAEKVVEKGADVGISLDGDGDRIIMSDEKGNILDGDALLAICARHMKRQGTLKGDAIVGTVMTNLGIVASLKAEGISVLPTGVGDRNVLYEMRERGLNLGGEQSGHVIFLDYNTTGDALVSAMQVLLIMKETGQRLSELASFARPYPQTLLNIPVKQKPPLTELTRLSELVGQVEQKMGSKGRVLIRYSGTEPLCRVMVEGESEGMIQEIAQTLAACVQAEIGA
ncbi:MAG: phosphoglucosamine mutase [Parachlamydiales bacterium]